MSNPNPVHKFKKGVVTNPNGRPKRKTLTELIHAKLDDTPEAWNAIINTVIKKILEDKDKEIIKTFWNYTDGMPKQKNDHNIDGKIEVSIKDYGTDSDITTKTEGST